MAQTFVQTFVYRPLNRPVAIIHHCELCTGVIDCTCTLAGTKVPLTEADYDQKFPAPGAPNPATVALGAVAGGN